MDTAKPDIERAVRLVRDVATALVDEEAGISVAAFSGTECTVIELRTAPGQVGQVIGKQGRISEAIRILLNAHSAKVQHRFTLEILEH